MHIISLRVPIFLCLFVCLLIFFYLSCQADKTCLWKWAWAWLSINKDGNFGAIQLKSIEWKLTFAYKIHRKQPVNRMVICFSLLSINKIGVCVHLDGTQFCKFSTRYFLFTSFQHSSLYSFAMPARRSERRQWKKKHDNRYGKKTPGFKWIEFAFAFGVN